MANDEYREPQQQDREVGLRARHETRRAAFDERVRQVLSEALWDGTPWVSMRPSDAYDMASAAYGALLDAGYVVIPAAEIGSKGGSDD